MAQVKFEDDCKTADDVRARAAKVREFQKKMRALPSPSPKQPPIWGVPLPSAYPAREWCISGRFLYTQATAARPPNINFSVGHLEFRGSPRVVDIVSAVAKETGIPVIDITSDRRTANVVAPRHLAMALCRRLTGRSLPHIGKMIGGRDHTTVIHACEKYGPLLDAVAGRLGTGASVADLIAESWKEIRNRPTLGSRKSKPVQAAA